jgi:hypothetical protein
MYDIQFPSLTQFSVWGAYDPRIADPSTNSGKSDVSLDRTRSRTVVDVDDDVDEEVEEEEEEEEEDSSSEDGDAEHDVTTPRRILHDER